MASMIIETMVTVPLSEYRDGVQARERLENLKLIVESEKFLPGEQIKAILGISPIEELKEDPKDEKIG